AVLIKMIPGGKKENESPEKTSEAQAGVPWNKGIQRFKMIMVISLAQLIMCYAIPVIYLRYYYGQFQKVEDFLFLLVILSAFIAFQASLITEIRRTGKYLKPVRDYSLLFFVLFTLFAIPVSIGAALLFDIEPEFFFEPNSPLLLIISIISVVFSLTALAITWKEARKEEKSFLPAFKFVVVSVNLFWQLSLCFHIFYDLSSYLLYYYFEYYNRVYIFDDLKNFGLPLVILSVVFIILHLLFFGNIIFKRGFEGKQRMQLPVLGVFLAAGVYALITLQIWAVRLLPMETNIIICVIMLSFIAIMGPVLVVALLLVGAGGIAALFGRKAGTGPEMTEKGTQLLQVRIKVVIIMLIAIVMYSFLFKTVWPVKDPAIGVLTGLMKKKEPFRRNLVYWGAFRYAAHYELFLYGKKAEEPLMEFLDGNDSQLRLIAANHLAHLKCPGSVDAAYATIVQLMDDEIQPIKRNALKILRLKEEPGAAKVLVRLLDFKKPQVRLKALVLIEGYYLGVHKIVEPLIRALDDNYTAVRNEAVHALAFLHDTRVIEPLFKI
ncbi:MAG: HEAT repeat domain-containing protein, partial [bacterium]|nr:HEAT repeat domain-containing protein [bacterium]